MAPCHSPCWPGRRPPPQGHRQHPGGAEVDPSRPTRRRPIYIILGNLSAHTGANIRRWAKKNKVELCFTATYTSWANPIEAHFGPLPAGSPSGSPPG